jgi:hypothetical protein
MGTVYEAMDERLAAPVALKETHFRDERLRRHFENEARLLARLRHPALPDVTDHFTEDDRQFLVMEFIPGRDLWEMLLERGAPFTPAEVLKWADQLLDALAYLHAQDPPVVHCDIKPQNLKLADRNQIILLDFGLAKGYRAAGAGAGTTLNPTQTVVGASRAYAPLEQLLQVNQDLREALAILYPDEVRRILRDGTGPRSDLYSLGTTLVHLLTGEVPASSAERFGLVLQGKPDPLHGILRGKFHAPLVELLQRATALGADERYGSADEMRASLRAVSDDPADAAAGGEATLVDVAPPRPTRPGGEGSDEPEEAPAPKRRRLERVRILFRKFTTMKGINLIAALIAASATLFAGLLPYVYKPAPVPEKEVEYAGLVLNKESHAVAGATVVIRDEQGNIQVRQTDSVGRYQYVMRPSTQSAHFTVTADGYLTYERDLSPTQTRREPFILAPAPPNPTPSVTPTPGPTASPRPVRTPRRTASPCSARDVLLGKC